MTIQEFSSLKVNDKVTWPTEGRRIRGKVSSVKGDNIQITWEDKELSIIQFKTSLSDLRILLIEKLQSKTSNVIMI